MKTVVATLAGAIALGVVTVGAQAAGYAANTNPNELAVSARFGGNFGRFGGFGRSFTPYRYYGSFGRFNNYYRGYG